MANLAQSSTLASMLKLKKEDVKQITALQAMYCKPGEVLLVRSENVRDLGDHFIKITGAPVVKEHGLRPQTETILATNKECSELLDEFVAWNGSTLLKLCPESVEIFYNSLYSA
jgi:hypothetical protein